MTAAHTAIIDDQDKAAGSARSSSFFTAMRIMPKREREAMYEIYHFCRTVDDIADEDGKVVLRLEQLEEWRKNIELIYAGSPPNALKGLAKAIKDFSLLKQDFIAIIDGMEMDVKGPIQAPDLTTLELYCDRVACAVGRLSVRVFGLKENDGLLLSHHLGLALQLTNILRDLDEDALINRLYLPKELLLQEGITSANPKQVLAEPTIEKVCMALAATALNHFRSADEIMKRYERKYVRTPRVMSEAYQAIYNTLIKRGFSSPRHPIRLNKIKLGYIILRTLFF